MSISFEGNSHQGLTITAESGSYSEAMEELWEAIQERENFDKYMMQVSVQDDDGEWSWYSSKVNSGEQLDDFDAYEEMEGLVDKARKYSMKSALSRNSSGGIAIRVITW